VSRNREITTLGRGGSDTTAVALAAALKADRCEIFTDVDGIFTADPRRVKGARVIPEIRHDEMLELAASGAQVMHPRAVDIAARDGVDIRVLSSFVEDDEAGASPRGTLITRTPKGMEDLVVTAVTPARGYAKLILDGLPAGLRSLTEVITALSAAGISVDMISEAACPGGTQLQVTLHADVLQKARGVIDEVVARLGGTGVQTRDGLSRIALVGWGMHGRPGVYTRAFQALLAHDVEVHAVSTSSISITVLVPTEREDAALNALHTAFALELDPNAAVGAEAAG
jgi:aspartate kinase